MLACERNESDFLDNDIAIKYTDSVGTDLLDPSYENSILAAEVDLYYLNEGIKTRVFNPEMDLPENFKIEYSITEKCYILVVFLNEKYDINKFSETVIEFKNRVDTIRASWDVGKDGNSIIYHNVWYNSELKITEGPSQFLFEVVL